MKKSIIVVLLVMFASMAFALNYSAPSANDVRNQYSNLMGEGALSIVSGYKNIYLDLSQHETWNTAANTSIASHEAWITGQTPIIAAHQAWITGATPQLAQALGYVSVGTSKPTCAAGYRGVTYVTAGGTGVADIFEVCAKNSSDAYVWVTSVTIP